MRMRVGNCPWRGSVRFYVRDNEAVFRGRSATTSAAIQPIVDVEQSLNFGLELYTVYDTR